jgi:DNA uptake protein ComE-like DNA-binding protein
MSAPQSPPLRNGLGAAWQRFARGGWYFLIVIATMGILSAVPFGHAAARLRNPALWAWTAGYAVAAFMLVALTPTTPRDAAGQPVQSADSGSPVIAFLALAMAVVACLHLRSVRRRVYGLPDPVRAPAGVQSSDPAVAAALAARSRRDEARKLAEVDPLLARELRIGRPDLSRTYDDGGLVDVNSAPAAVVADVCGVDPAIAHRIVEARAAAGAPFARVEDIFVYTDIPVELWDRIREHAVVLTR